MIDYRKIKGFIALFRPELPFAAGVCVIMGEIIALGSFPSFQKLFLGFAWGFFLSSPSMILNDYFDIDVDKINAPHKPLPSGLISSFETITLTLITTLIGLITSLLIGLPALVLYIIFWIMGFLYNWKLKEMGLRGNLLVSSSVAITFIFGGFVVGEPWNKSVWVLSLMAFFINLGLEIAADAMDIEGDKKRNVKSIAIIRGKKFALSISRSLFLLAILTSFLPVIWGWLGTSYLIMISFTNTMILFFTIKLFKSVTPEEGRYSLRGLYLCALLGMLAFIIGKVFFLN